MRSLINFFILVKTRIITKSGLGQERVSEYCFLFFPNRIQFDAQVYFFPKNFVFGIKSFFLYILKRSIEKLVKRQYLTGFQK
jgi:hypothetical protein